MTEVIDEQAPVAGASETEIAATPEVVWDVLTAIERWPKWNPAVKSASMHGELAKGSEFRWKAGPGTITSTTQQVEPPQLIVWTGKTFGIKAVHVHTLEPRNGKPSSGRRSRTRDSSPASSVDRCRKRSTRHSRTGSRT
jgi:uncharacterized protein YndB with AHSA1/START domain